MYSDVIVYNLTVVAQKLKNNKIKPDWRHAETFENRVLVTHSICTV